MAVKGCLSTHVLGSCNRLLIDSVFFSRSLLIFGRRIYFIKYIPATVFRSITVSKTNRIVTTSDEQSSDHHNYLQTKNWSYQIQISNVLQINNLSPKINDSTDIRSTTCLQKINDSTDIRSTTCLQK